MEGLKRRLEGEIEITVAGGNALFETCVKNPDYVSKISRDFIQGCDLIEGAFGIPGSKIRWRYTLDGKAQTSTEILEVVDEENKLMKFNCIEGDSLNEYKSFVVVGHVISKDTETSIVKWIFEYVKLNQSTPEPTSYMDAEIALAKDFDDHSKSK